MNLKIKQAVSLNEIGQRQNNEDAIYPLKEKATQEDRLFLVCDGVGGANKGEVASNMVTQAIPWFFKEYAENGVNHDFLEVMLHYTEKELSTHRDLHPECAGMATTLTLLHLAKDQALIGWCGDSRVYHFRDDQILYETEDHSLVMKLLQEGAITAEEAENHPKKNVILRAVTGMENPTTIDSHVIEDIQAGDFFLLCTDGVLEAWTNTDLKKLMGDTSLSLQEKNQLILKKCQLHSKDNFSLYLVEIAGTSPEVEAAQTATAEIKRSEPKKLIEEAIEPPIPPKSDNSQNRLIWGGLLLGILLLSSALGFIKYRQYETDQKYHQLISDGDAFFKEKNYQLALQKYQAIDKDKISDNAYIQHQIQRIQKELRVMAELDSIEIYRQKVLEIVKRDLEYYRQLRQDSLFSL